MHAERPIGDGCPQALVSAAVAVTAVVAGLFATLLSGWLFFWLLEKAELYRHSHHHDRGGERLMVNVLLGFGRTVEVGGETLPVVRVAQMPTLLAVYGAGFAAVFIILALLYWNAYRKRADLELSELETHDTRSYVQENALMALVGLLSVGLALSHTAFGSLFAGLVYCFRED